MPCKNISTRLISTCCNKIKPLSRLDTTVRHSMVNDIRNILLSIDYGHSTLWLKSRMEWRDNSMSISSFWASTKKLAPFSTIPDTRPFYPFDVIKIKPTTSHKEVKLFIQNWRECIPLINIISTAIEISLKKKNTRPAKKYYALRRYTTFRLNILIVSKYVFKHLNCLTIND